MHLIRASLAAGALLGTLAFLGCGGNTAAPASTPALSVAFSLAPEAPEAGQDVQFTDTSTGSPTSWVWDFGDGTSSTLQHPVHNFAAEGSFTVTLSARGAGGSATLSRVVGVAARPKPLQAAFSFVPGPPNSQTVLFTDTSTGSPRTWTWSFGDGTSSTLKNPAHTYASTGTFTVTLTIGNGTTTASTSRQVTVGGGDVVPAAACTLSPEAPEAGQSVTFHDTSTGTPTSWTWTFGDGATSSLQHPAHAYANPGTYTVTLAARNAAGTGTATRSLTISPAGTAPVAAFTFTPASPLAGQAVQFSDTSTGTPASWAWNFGDGATSNAQHPSHTYTSAGSYAVTLVVGNPKGTSTASRTLTVSTGGTFTLVSSVGTAGGTLPIDYTLDGSGASPDLSWTGAPAATREFALLMTTLPGDGTTLWNWVLYRIPATAASLARNTSGVGAAGQTSHSVLGYAPPQSTGPGSKTYTFTLYALSASPTLPADPTQVTGDALTKAIAPLTLGSASLSLSYARSAPAAGFTTTVNGQAVTFTSTSGLSTTSWAWTFGDGATASTANPVHTYAASGTYPVSLTVGNAFGTRTASRQVTVGSAGAPTASFFVAPATPTATQTVVFTDTSTGGATSWAWTFGDGGTSTLQYPAHAYAANGTYTVTLTATSPAGTHTATRTLAVGPAVPLNAKMNMAQTLSDQAQRTTLAFSGLAMMTGNLEAQSFFPPGKVADYTGFQYLRDNDPSNMGHNTSFLTRVANNVIHILNATQLAQLATLATAQQTQFDLYGYKRFPLMKAFRRLLDGDLPTGATGLNLNAVKKASRELYLIDGQISFDRALLYANIYASLDATQKAYLDAMVGKGWSAWPDITEDQIKEKMKALPQGSAVAVMTYASDIFSWYACPVEGDVYFCPERQGTYYGGFYIKDAPAIGHEGYGIDEQLTATAGAALCDASKGYVTASQATTISALVDTQRANLYGSATSSIVQYRTQIATLLRALRTSTTQKDVILARVLALSGTYGDLDGENNYHYATVFAQVHKTLTADQKTKLMALRKQIMSGTYADGTPFDFTTCTTPFLYSAVIKDTSVLAPYIANTDYLFFEP